MSDSKLGALVGFPSQERLKDLEKAKNSILKEFEGMTSSEISLILKLVKDSVNEKLIFTI